MATLAKRGMATRSPEYGHKAAGTCVLLDLRINWENAGWGLSRVEMAGVWMGGDSGHHHLDNHISVGRRECSNAVDAL